MCDRLDYLERNEVRRRSRSTTWGGREVVVAFRSPSTVYGHPVTELLGLIFTKM